MTIDYTTSAGRVRHLSGDTDETYPLLSDNEITADLAMADDNVLVAAALACRSIAAKAARGAFDLSILAGELSIDKSSIPKYFISLAEKYESMAALGSSADYSVDWGLRIDRADGRDRTGYDDTSEEEYFDVTWETGE